MSAASAKVIDFQAYRSTRLPQQPAQSSGMATPATMPFAPMAWLPVWFMPVYFVGVGQPSE